MKNKILLIIMLLVTAFGLAFSGLSSVEVKASTDTVMYDLNAIHVPGKAISSFPVTYESVYGNTITWSVEEGQDVITYDSEAHWMVVNRSKDEDNTITITLTVSDGTNEASSSFDVVVPAGETATPSYAISYNLNEGNFKANEEEKTSYKLGDATYLLPTPEKDGYAFGGWYTNAELSGETVTKILVGSHEDINLYAKWTISQYTLTYDTAGGNEIEAVTVDYNTKVTLPTPTKEGYKFAGWKLDETTYQAGEEYTLTSNVTLVAQWTINQYTLTYDTAGGNEIEAVIVDYNTKVTLPTPTKEGYTFAGWKLDETTYQAGEEYTLTSNVTLVAQWTINQYTLAYDTDGGNEIEAVTVDYNTKVTLPTPTKEGYTFAGWKLNETTYQAGDEYTLTSNVTLVAQWELSEETIMAEVIAQELREQYESLNGAVVTNIPALLVEHNDVKAVISWTCSSSAVEISEWGIPTITFPEDKDIEVTLWATVSYDNSSSSIVEFTFIIPAKVNVSGLEEGYTFNSTQDTNEQNYQINDGEVILAVYDITILDENNEAVSNPGNVTVRLLIPEEYRNLENLTIYHVNNGENEEVADVTRVGDYLEFTANSFSPYIIGYAVPESPTCESDIYAMLKAGVREFNFTQDIIVDTLLIDGYDVVFNLGNWTINPVDKDLDGSCYGVYAINGAVVTINANENGGIKTLTPAGWNIPLRASKGSTINVNGGTYYAGVNNSSDLENNGTSCMYVSDTSVINIYDGVFETEGSYNKIYFVFNIQGGSAAKINVFGGTSVNQSPTKLVQEGYKVETEVIEGKTYYSVVQEVYTITYDTDGGNEIEAVTVDYNTKVTLPTSTKEGYTFAGWKLNETTYQAGDEYTLTSNVTLVAQWEKNETLPTYVVWERVDDVTNLVVGDQIVIVAKDSNFALSTTQNDNNRSSITLTKNDDFVDVIDGVQIIILEAGLVDGTFALKVDDGYLYAASSSNNQLRTQKTLTENSSWKITINSGVATVVAQGSYTRNTLMYNSQNNIFSAYGSGQQDISIYKKVQSTENPFVKYSVTYVTNCEMKIDSQLILSGKTITKPSISKDGFNLIGWYSDENFTNEWNFESDTVTKNVTLYAKWEEKSSGSVTKTETISIFASTGTLASDSSSIAWTNSDFTFVNSKGNSSTAIRTSDPDHYRVYANSDVTISCNGKMTEVKITCTSSSYAGVMETSLKNSGYTVTVSGNVVTVSGIELSEITFTLSSQSRLKEIEVTYVI